MEVALELGNAGSVLRCVLKRSYTAIKTTLKAVSCTESVSLLREYLGVPEQNVERNMGSRGILMRSPVDVKNMLLETGGKVTLVIKWQTTWLNCVHVLVSCRR